MAGRRASCPRLVEWQDTARIRRRISGIRSRCQPIPPHGLDHVIRPNTIRIDIPGTSARKPTLCRARAATQLTQFDNQWVPLHWRPEIIIGSVLIEIVAWIENRSEEHTSELQSLR